MHTAIQVENLTRIFTRRGTAPFHALRGVSFDVSYGEIFGLLGPNGAGKTTIIKIMSTLLLPTSGCVTVAGFDVEKDYTHIRPLISLISGGETSGYGILTVEEQLWMFSQFYGMETPVARARIEEYLKIVGMWDSRRQQMNRTTWQRQMNCARAWLLSTMGLSLRTHLHLNLRRTWTAERTTRLRSIDSTGNSLTLSLHTWVRGTISCWVLTR